MPKLEYFLIARSISLDAERNSLSIFHVMNDCLVPEIPGTIAELVLVSAWMFSSDELQQKRECQLRMEFRLPGSEDPIAFRGNMEASVRFQSFNLSFADVPIESAGDVVVTIYLDDQPMATHTLEIRTE
jgi:hypothetical protein